MRRGLGTLTAAVLLVVAGACTAAPPDAGSAASSAPATPSGTTPATSPPPRVTTAPPGGPDAAPGGREPHPVSLPALFDRRFTGRQLRPGPVLSRTDAYTERLMTYRSGALTISGTMHVPRGRGPFPVLVLAHGYIDPAVYVTGQGLSREQEWLARAGYVVVHVDYRNHAGSDRDPRADLRLRLGYTVDVVNAVRALRRSTLPYLDRERVGLVGRSMGGGVVYNVLAVAPGLVDAAVVFAPVSSRTADNVDRWIRRDPARADLADRITARYGTPEGNRAFWRAVSPRTYFHRITEPVLIHHGTADASCPLRWSRRSLALLRASGVQARLLVYRGEPHAFLGQWPTSMRRTVRFLERHLG